MNQPNKEDSKFISKRAEGQSKLVRDIGSGSSSAVGMSFEEAGSIDRSAGNISAQIAADYVDTAERNRISYNNSEAKKEMEKHAKEQAVLADPIYKKVAEEHGVEKTVNIAENQEKLTKLQSKSFNSVYNKVVPVTLVAKAMGSNLVGPGGLIDTETVATAVKFFTDTARSIFTEDKLGLTATEQKEYKERKVQRDKEFIPIMQKIKAEDASYIKNMEQRFETAKDYLDVMRNPQDGVTDPNKVMKSKKYKDAAQEWSLLRIAMSNTKAREKHIDDFIAGDRSFWSNLGAGIASKAEGLMSMGILPLANDLDTMFVVNKHNRIEKERQANMGEDGKLSSTYKPKEALTPAEEILLETVGRKQEVEAKELMKENLGYSWGAGVAESMIMMEGMIATAGTSGAVQKVVTEGIVKGALETSLKNAFLTGGKKAMFSHLGAKVIGGAASIATTTLLSPMMYGIAANDQIGSAEFITDAEGNRKLVVGESRYNHYKKDYEKRSFLLEQEIAKLTKNTNRSPSQETTLMDLIQRAEDFKEEFDLLQKPSTVAESIWLGFSESAKETFSEKYIGDAIPGLANNMATRALGRGIRKAPLGAKILDGATDIGKRVGNSKLVRVATAPVRGYKATQNTVNNLVLGKLSSKAIAHTGQAGLIHSLPGEMAEEVWNQLVPTYKSDYKKQLEELTNPSFYRDIAAQTLLMGGGFAMVGMGMRRRGFQQDKTKLKDLYKRMDAAVTDDAVAEHILMNTGGTVFSPLDYDHKIAQLRSKGDHAGANKLEQNKFTNLAAMAIRTGTIEDFKENLDKVANSTSPDISASTKSNILLAKNRIDELAKVYEEHSEKDNFYAIFNTAERQIANRQVLSQVNEELMNLREGAKEDIDNFLLRTGRTMDYDMDSLLTKDEFESPEAKAEYIQFIEDLNAEKITRLGTYAALYDTKVGFEVDNAILAKTYNDQTSHDYADRVVLKKHINETYNSLLKAYETSEITSENTEFNYNNELEVTEKLIDEATTKVKERYKGRIDSKLFDELATAKKRDLEQKKVKKHLELQQLNLKRLLEAREKMNLPVEANDPSDPNSDIPIEDGATVTVRDDVAEADYANFVNAGLNVMSDMFTEENSTTSPPAMGETEATQGAFVIDDNEFDDSIESERGNLFEEYEYTPEQLAAIKAFTKESVERIANKLGRTPTFRELMEQTYKYAKTQQDKDNLKKTFPHMIQGWKENKYPDDNFTGVYIDLFNPYEGPVVDFLGKMVNLFDTEVAVEPKNIHREFAEEVEKAEKEIAKAEAVVVAYDEENRAQVIVPEFVDSGDYQVDPKVGFLGMPYVDNWIGQKFVRQTSENRLNYEEGDLVDSRDLMNPNMYPSGTKLGLEIADESLWGQIKVSNGRNERNLIQTIEFDKWVKEREATNPDFRQTQEFRDKVPVFYVDSTGKKVGTVHDPDWYNEFTVNPPTGSNKNKHDITPGWAERIQKGKDGARKLRDNIHRGLKEVTVKRGISGPYNKVPKELPKITLAEANPQSTLVVQVGESLQINPSTPFVGMLDGTQKFNSGAGGTNGHTFQIVQVGMAKNKQGVLVPVYRALPVGRPVSPEQIETARWALAAHLTLKGGIGDVGGWAKRLKGTPYEMSVAQAEKISADVNAAMGYSLRDPIDSVNFLKTYFQPAIGGDHLSSFSKVLFPEDKSEPVTFGTFVEGGSSINVKQHTNLSLLNKPRVDVVNITRFGVERTGKNYEDYLKGTLTTDLQALNVGTTEKPVYATIVQPTIGITYTTIAEETPAQQTEKKQEEVKELVEKVKEEIQEKPTVEIDFDKHNEILNHLGVDLGDFEDYNDAIVSTDKLSNIFQTIGNLNISQEKAIRQFILHSIGEKVSLKYKASTSKSSIREDVRGELGLYLNQLIPQLKGLLEELDNASVPSEKLEALKLAYTTTLNNALNIKAEFDNLFEKAFLDIQKQTQLSAKEDLLEEDEVNGDEETQNVKDYSKESIEESGKAKASYRLRRFLHKINRYDTKGEIQTAYLGLPEYMSFNDVYNEVSKILSVGSEVGSSFDAIMERLSQATESPFAAEVHTRLSQADQQIKNEFVYNFVRHTLSSKFGMYVSNMNGIELKMYDTNANEASRVILKRWKNDNGASGLYNKNGTFNADYAKILIADYETWNKDFDPAYVALSTNPELSFTASGWNSTYKITDEKQVENYRKELASKDKIKFTDEVWNELVQQVKQTAKVRDWMDNLGYTFQDSAWKKITGEGVFNAKKQYTFREMFTLEGGLFTPAIKHLKDAAANPALYSVETGKDVFSVLQGFTKSLALVEAKHNPSLITLSFRDTKKNISTLVPTKYITDMVENLKRSASDGTNSLIGDLKSLSFSEDSVMLELLEEHPSFSKLLGAHHISLTAIKERGKNPIRAGITDLSDLDYDQAGLAGFQDRKVDKLPEGTKLDGVHMRMAHMLSPTMSDKSTGLYIFTGVFDFLRGGLDLFDMAADGKVTGYKPALKQLLFKRLVLPELKRIIKFHREVKGTNIKDYDNGAQLFHLLPIMNTLKAGDDVRILDKLADPVLNYSLEEAVNEFQSIFEDAIEGVMQKEVEHKKATWEAYKTTDKKGRKISKLFDTNYFSESKNEKINPETGYDLAVQDFVLNNILFNADMFKVFAGDIAMYSQDKLYKENGVSVAPHKITDDATYISINKQIGTNLGKRLALLIAPGNKIANSRQKVDGTNQFEEYNQIFLEDAVDIAENSAYLIKTYYGEKSYEEVKPLLEKYKENADKIQAHEEGSITLEPASYASVKTEMGKTRKFLADKFKDLNAYFDIESTDAQEYTTAAEHIDVLHRMGRISDEEFSAISTKLLSVDKEGNPTEAGYLTKEELNLVLQPVKPVYTGTHVDKAQDVNRVIYIKSSSFPLLPQLTAGTGLDALRKKMEALEVSSGKATRASFQTANKVGSTRKKVNPFDMNSLNDIKIYDANDPNSTVLQLKRDNFRIQQDVPFKSDKAQDDKVAMGTQFFKLLFGDGILGEDYTAEDRDAHAHYPINDGMMTGKELYAHYNKAFKDIVDSRKAELFSELGLSERGTIIDQNQFMVNLQELLVKEATDRGYSIKSIAGLSIEQLQAKTGIYYEFKTPLWLSSDSNRYESLLNAIVTNRIMKHKVPGNSFVAGSESGFRFQENMDGIEKSRIVYLDSWNGKELQSVHTTEVDGEVTFHKAQVFVPSKFKDENKKLIDLFKGFNHKTGDATDAKYLVRRENGTLGLKPNMINEELLNSFSFRTPTSSHVSGATIEIAGILPPESGDLILVPKSFTKQKGLDFDVDKESTYQLNHYMNSEGAVKPLDRVEVDRRLKEMEGQSKGKIKRTRIDLERKLAENEFIRVHLAIYNSTNPDVQKKINKVLSMDFAGKQAKLLEAANAEGEKELAIKAYKLDNPSLSDTDARNRYDASLMNFTMLTSTYQKQKINLGSIGKTAIGVYANYTTFNGLLQQNVSGQSVHITDADGVPRTITLGNFQSDGSLGVVESLSPNTGKMAWESKHQRRTAEVFAERENTATDNEKEQILGRVGVTDETLNIDAYLSLLGFDKDENGNSISYLLLSQPAVKNYNEIKKTSKGILGEFVKQEELIAKTVTELSGGTVTYAQAKVGGPFIFMDVVSKELAGAEGKLLTGTNMLAGVETAGGNKKVQLAAFMSYIELEKEAREVSKVQKTINANSLGKSMIESQLKYKALQELPNNPLVKSAESLLGSFSPVSTKEAGEIKVGGYFVVPNTPQGQIVINGMHLGNTIYKDFFPYHEEAIQSLIKEILKIQGKEEVSDSTMIAQAEEIVEGIKKYIYSRKGNNVFDVDPKLKRYELFKDDENNVSLSTYMKSVVRNDEAKFKRGLRVLSQNALVRSLSYETAVLEEDLSLIKYNNAATDNLDEEELYNAIPELILMNKALPPRNGQPYSTLMLAQDLVSYAFLQGGVQKATEFVKFIPVEYLETVGRYEKQTLQSTGEQVEVFVPANRKLQSFNSKKNSDINIFGKALGLRDNAPSIFTRQYFQHNPDKVTKISYKDKKNELGDRFEYKDETGKSPEFVSVKSEKGSAQPYKLYEKIGSVTYQRIDILGDKGTNEYEYMNASVFSINTLNIPVEGMKEEGKLKEEGTPFGIIPGQTTIKELATSISEAVFPARSAHLAEAAKWLLPLIKKEGKLIMDGTIPSAGRAMTLTSDIKLNPTYTTEVSPEKTAVHFIHELVHTVSVQEVNKYYQSGGITLRTDMEIPPHVKKLDQVFHIFRDMFQEEIAAFEEKRANKLKNPSANVTFTEREAQLLYAGSNIREFLAVSMTSPMFKEEMNEVILPNGKTAWEQIKEILMDVLDSIYPGLKDNTLARESIMSSFNFIQEEARVRTAEKEKQIALDLQLQLVKEEAERVKLAAADKSKEVKTEKEFDDPDADDTNFEGDTDDPANDVEGPDSINLSLASEEKNDTFVEEGKEERKPCDGGLAI